MRKNINKHKIALQRIKLRHEGLVTITNKRNESNLEDMNERDLRRIYGKEYNKKLISSNDETNNYLIFDNKYEIKTNVDYDVIIIIPTYNRIDFLLKIINQIINTETKYTYKIIVLDDGSDIPINLIEYENITVLRNDTNNGKFLYWKTIGMLFSESLKYTSHCIIQIDDDFILTKSFLNKVVTKFFEIKNENNKHVAIKCHLSDNKLDNNRWGYKNNWIDGGGLYDTELIRLINNEKLEISPNRWKHNPLLGSGVWHKISGIINKNNLLIYVPDVSYMRHDGNEMSMMNFELRKNNKINTYNFDDE